jgi:hypothetical protein
MGKNILKMLVLMIVIMSSIIGHVSAAPTKEVGNQIVKGALKDGATSLKNSQVLLQSKGHTEWTQVVTDATGAFQAKLEDGTYAVKGIKGNKTGWYSTNGQFVVEEGIIKGVRNGEVVLSDKKPSKSALSKSSNLTGVLKEGQKGLKADLIISKYNEYEEEMYIVSSKGNGSFSASLPDGNYYLFGIESEGGFYRYDLGFSVVDGKVVVDGVEKNTVDITLPVNAYSGKIQDSSALISDANIILEKRLSDEEYDTEFIQHVLSNKKGEFSLRELVDGNYSISVYHETFTAWNYLTFEIVDGDIYIEGLKASTLQLLVPDVNLKGKLMEGNRPISNAYLFIEGENDGFGTPVDAKGQFQYRLLDGQYSIFSVDEQNRSTYVNIQFEIRDGKLIQNGEVTKGLTITLPPVTFSGSLMDEGTILHGAIYVEKATEDGDYEYYHGYTDEKGIYSLRLKDGSYQVVGGYLFDEGEDVGFYQSFDIVDGKLIVDGQEQKLMELQVPPVSLFGLVKDGENVVEDGWITVRSEDRDYYSWKSVNSDGTFTMRLADGDYTIMDVELPDGTNALIGKLFSIKDGKTYVNGQLQEVLVISIPPVTVTGILTEEGNPVMGDLYIMELNDADDLLQAWSWANEEGKFQLRLPDGQYKVNNVYLYDGTTFNPGTEFSVVSGQLYLDENEAEQLTIQVPPISVTGKVVNGEKTVKEGYISFYSLDENGGVEYASWIEDGFFQGRLPDGEYQIRFLVDYQNGYYTSDRTFTIAEGKIIVDDLEVSMLNFDLQDGWQLEEFE